MKERSAYRGGGERVCVRERGRTVEEEIKKEGGSGKIVTKPAAKTNHL